MDRYTSNLGTTISFQMLDFLDFKIKFRKKSAITTGQANVDILVKQKYIYCHKNQIQLKHIACKPHKMSETEFD